MASEARLVIVELIKSLHTLNIETVFHLVKEVVKRPHQIKGEQVHKQILKTFTVVDFQLKGSDFSPPEGNAGRYSHAAVQLCLCPEVKMNLGIKKTNFFSFGSFLQ